MSVRPSVRPSVRKEQLGFNWMDFHEIWNLSVFRKPVEKIQVSLTLTRIKSTVHEDQYTFLTISPSVRLRTKNVSGKVEKIETFYVQEKNVFFRKPCRLWDNVENFVERGRTHMTVRRIRIACWIPKATNTHAVSKTYCFSTAKMIARTRLSVTFIRTLSLLFFVFLRSLCCGSDYKTETITSGIIYFIT
jgi:hypothetical protein